MQGPSLPQVSLDANDVLSKKPEARVKWIDKCIKLASLKQLSLQDAFFSLIQDRRFFSGGFTEVQTKAAFSRIMRCMKYLSTKQSHYLCR